MPTSDPLNAYRAGVSPRPAARHCTGAALLLVLLIQLLLAPAARAAAVHLTVLHVNDFHGHLLSFAEKSLDATAPVGGASVLGAMIAQERAKNPEGTLLLAAGDMFQGTPISNLTKGQPVLEIMNSLGFDAMAVGNHEFDWGPEALVGLRQGSRFPWLSANIADSSGQPPFGLAPYRMIERKGVKIAVIGLTTPETPYATSPANVAGLTFSDPARVLPDRLAELRRNGAQVIIVLSHLGLDADVALASAVSGIDLIVGGHSHTAVTTPVRVGSTTIVQAGCYGMYLGVVALDVEKGVSVPSAELRVVHAGPDAPQDAAIARTVAAAQAQVGTAFTREVGESLVDLQRQDYAESNIGDLITDAMREETGAAVAIHNGGGIRADLPKGKITLEMVYTTLPFDNRLTMMDLTGAQIQSLLEQSATLEKRILQVSGLTATCDMTRPAGSRLTKVNVGGQPLDPKATYRVVTNDFLAAGGDRFATFKEGTHVETGGELREAFLSYLQKHPKVAPTVEGRLNFIK